MKELLPKLKYHKVFVLFAVVLSLTIIIVENINGRFNLNDFKVYYEAASALLSENQVYGIPFGLKTGYYKYSPATLLFFLPYCAFSFGVAKVLHFIVLACCAISTIVFLHYLVRRWVNKGKVTNAILAVTFLCILVHMVRELHLGNINIVLVAFVSAALYYIAGGREKRAGWLLGFVFVTKPYFLILLLPLVLHQKRVTLLHVTLSFVFFALAPAAVVGFSDNIALHQDWFKAVMAHNSYLESDNTIASILQVYTSLEIPQYFTLHLLIALGLVYVAVFWRNRKHAVLLGEESKDTMGRLMMMECFVLIAIIPNLVITDTEHFLYALPVIVMLLRFLQEQKNTPLLVGFIVVILLYGANSSDFVGKYMAKQLDHFGALGISNLLLISLMGYFVYYREVKALVSDATERLRQTSVGSLKH
ncbi:glycosyltransferase family 87 protein [uncultured Pontibacter sp.]|uniref:glycosyltransferase family 87 protein n=1 Tax=uncultured Pontibacter sp. TaxID=453356 RepID=UPI002606C4B0|nr:glycosyltransferase family 87 protein [uncultured Pontibacter sp.]